MDSTQIPPHKSSQLLMSTAAHAIAHLSVILIIATLIAWAVLPMPSLQMLLQYNTDVADVRSMSVSSLILQFGLASCIWAMCIITYKLMALHRTAPTTTRLHTSRGTVLTETLIIMPVFLLLTFGLAQLSINNMAGMLANVAVYEATRAVWIWQPEVDSERFPDENPADRARIAVAQVMTPIAPGDFRIMTSGSDLSDHFKASRKALLAAQVPFGGHLSDMLPDGLTDGLTATLPGTDSGEHLSFYRGLDSQKFIVRSYTKYTHAYLATNVEVINDGGNLGARVTYQHNQVMPLVGGIFGSRVGLLGFGGPGQRGGYYSNYTREFTLPAQPWLPNKQMPQNAWNGGTDPQKPDSKCQISTGANQNSGSSSTYDDEC